MVCRVQGYRERRAEAAQRRVHNVMGGIHENPEVQRNVDACYEWVRRHRQYVEQCQERSEEDVAVPQKQEHGIKSTHNAGHRGETQGQLEGHAH
jgi:hypothetical protein